VTHTLLHAALTSDEFSNQKARAYEYSSGEYRTPVKKSVGQCFHLSLLDLGKAKRWYFQSRNGEAFSLPRKLLFWREPFGMLSGKLIVPLCVSEVLKRHALRAAHDVSKTRMSRTLALIDAFPHRQDSLTARRVRPPIQKEARPHQRSMHASSDVPRQSVFVP
jgi:hypothetical protein